MVVGTVLANWKGFPEEPPPGLSFSSPVPTEALLPAEGTMLSFELLPNDLQTLQDPPGS